MNTFVVSPDDVDKMFSDVLEGKCSLWDAEETAQPPMKHSLHRPGPVTMGPEVVHDKGFQVDTAMNEWFESRTPLLGLGPISPNVSDEPEPEENGEYSARADYLGAFGQLSCVHDQLRQSQYVDDSPPPSPPLLPAEIYNHPFEAPRKPSRSPETERAGPVRRSVSDEPTPSFAARSGHPHGHHAYRHTPSRTPWTQPAFGTHRSEAPDYGHGRPFLRSVSDSEVVFRQQRHPIHTSSINTDMAQRGSSFRSTTFSSTKRAVITDMEGGYETAHAAAPDETVVIPAAKPSRRSSAKRERPPKSGQCACCKSTSTPLWREGRNGVQLCNACGIRWVKYGIACIGCNYVPRKSESADPFCPRCKAQLPGAGDAEDGAPVTGSDVDDAASARQVQPSTTPANTMDGDGDDMVSETPAAASAVAVAVAGSVALSHRPDGDVDSMDMDVDDEGACQTMPSVCSVALAPESRSTTAVTRQMALDPEVEEMQHDEGGGKEDDNAGPLHRSHSGGGSTDDPVPHDADIDKNDGDGARPGVDSGPMGRSGSGGS
eukprot:m.159427 g.159427  ORF g.159427 m.159427 type:complete len:545 (-) comp11792_c0_seq1:306-1940(-)